MEPHDQTRPVDAGMCDRIAQAFSQVIDAKSPWTLRHSDGVAEIAVGIAATMGFPAEALQELRWARSPSRYRQTGRLQLDSGQTGEAHRR